MSKINELSIDFDEQRCMNDLITMLVRTVQIVLNNYKELLESDSAFKKTKDWEVGFDSSMLNNASTLIMGYVGTDNWNAFLENYGTGSKSARDNPWLEEYTESDYFNPLRDSGDMIVVCREEGDYDSPNYKEGTGEVGRYSKGKYEGQNLEETTIRAKNGHKLKVFTAKPPTYALETNLEKASIVLEKELTDVIENFDFSQYLIGGI